MEFNMPKGNSSIIKVIGVGGGGNNALKHMTERGIHGVDFVICNTDAQALEENPVNNKVQLGVSITEGLGAGADPEVGEKAAIESIDDIKAVLGGNTKMVFITAGMGGGTGTGAAPVVAKVAKEMGILTVAIVTVPFNFEGKRRLQQAQAGLERLKANVDSLIIINNDKVAEQFPDLDYEEAFFKADEVLTNAAKGMSEVITAPFKVNIDFKDAKSVLENSGTALMSIGVATGEKRAEEAVRKALDSPLLNDNKITGAKNVLLLILSGAEEGERAKMSEITLISNYIQQEAGGDNEANVILGIGRDEELGDAIKVLVIATGFSKDTPKNTVTTEKIKINLTDELPQPNVRRDSPFKSREQRTNSTENSIDSGKTIFRLDDDENLSFPKFEQNATEEVMVKEVTKTETYQLNEEVKYYGDEENTSKEALDLFAYDSLEEEKFAFEAEGEYQPQNENSDLLFEEEQPIEFTFNVKETEEEIEDFENFQQFQVEGKELEKKDEIKPIQPSAFQSKNEEIAETYKSEEEQFTFIPKKTNSEKVNERRNKLEQFNHRYQSVNAETDFEKIPAFRRKNIMIDDELPSEQKIHTFVSENNGEVQVRGNRFLNKDVD